MFWYLHSFTKFGTYFYGKKCFRYRRCGLPGLEVDVFFALYVGSYWCGYLSQLLYRAPCSRSVLHPQCVFLSIYCQSSKKSVLWYYCNKLKIFSLYKINFCSIMKEAWQQLIESLSNTFLITIFMIWCMYIIFSYYYFLLWLSMFKSYMHFIMWIICTKALFGIRHKMKVGQFYSLPTWRLM